MYASGNVGFLGREEWLKRRAQYIEIAEKHLQSCAFSKSNLYSLQRETWRLVARERH